MPPQPKFSKEKITKIAYKIVKKEGLIFLTARNLANKLGSSARPIFTVFKNMDDVKIAVREQALKEFEKNIIDLDDEKFRFKKMATKTVIYAISEPELFKVLFTCGEESEKEVTVCNLNGIEEIYLNTIIEEYNLNIAQAKMFFEQAWISIFGMSTLLMGKTFNFSVSEIDIKISQIIDSISISMNYFSYDEKELSDSLNEMNFEWIENGDNYKINEKIGKKDRKIEKEKIFSWLD